MLRKHTGVAKLVLGGRNLEAVFPHQVADLAYQSLFSPQVGGSADVPFLQCLVRLPDDEVRRAVQIDDREWLVIWEAIGRLLDAVDGVFAMDSRAASGQGGDVELPNIVGEDLRDASARCDGEAWIGAGVTHVLVMREAIRSAFG